MVQSVRRAKLGDIAGAALLLTAFAVVPFILLLTERSRVSSKSLRTAYAVCLGLSWPLLLLSALPLAYFWRLDRSLDPLHASTLNPAHLGLVLAAMVGVGVGCVLLLSGEMVGLIDLVRRGLEWVIVVDVAAILLLVWVALLVGRTAREVKGIRDSLVEVGAEQALSVVSAQDAEAEVKEERKPIGVV